VQFTRLINFNWGEMASDFALLAELLLSLSLKYDRTRCTSWLLGPMLPSVPAKRSVPFVEQVLCSANAYYL